jgi:GcrA cell cycle regulator
MTYWSDEQIVLLREICLQGSCSETARAINAKTGSRFSRNAIIGKIHRMRLQAMPRKGGRRTGPQAPRKRKVRRMQIELFAEPIVEAPQPTEFLGVTFLELKSGQCHYPRGDSDFLFCGQPVKAESSYCTACHAMTHLKPAPRTGKGWRNMKFRSAA